MPGQVGFYASVHDKKMTEKWDFRARPIQTGSNQRGDKQGKIRFASSPESLILKTRSGSYAEGGVKAVPKRQYSLL